MYLLAFPLFNIKIAYWDPLTVPWFLTSFSWSGCLYQLCLLTSCIEQDPSRRSKVVESYWSATGPSYLSSRPQMLTLSLLSVWWDVAHWLCGHKYGDDMQLCISLPFLAVEVPSDQSQCKARWG